MIRRDGDKLTPHCRKKVRLKWWLDVDIILLLAGCISPPSLAAVCRLIDNAAWVWKISLVVVYGMGFNLASRCQV